MNIEDIAKKAGVSKSTVSRVINDEPYVSAKTRARVQAIIDELGYTPNQAAKSLVTQRSFMIGTVVPGSLNEVFDNSSYFPTLIRGIADALGERDYSTLLWIGNKYQDEETFIRRIVNNRMADGYIVISPPINSTIIHELIKSQIPFVSTDRVDYIEQSVSFVTVENVMSTYRAINHLIKNGRKRIGMIAGADFIADTHDRIEGYKKALRDAGLPYDPEIITQGEYKFETGTRGAELLIDKNIDALFAHSDLIAWGAMSVFNARGVRIPDDIAIIGFDDLPIAQSVVPPLTSVHQPINEKGYQSAALLIDIIEGRAKYPQQIYLPAELVIRESSGG